MRSPNSPTAAVLLPVRWLRRGSWWLGGILGFCSTPILTTVAVASALVNKQFAPTTIYPGDISALTISVFNTDTFQLTNASLTDNLPAGLKVAPTPGIVNTCGGTVTAVANSTSISLAGGTIPASSGGNNGQCTIVVNVTSSVNPSSTSNYVNTIAVNALNNNEGKRNTSSATATLQVAPLAGLTVQNNFNPTTIVGGGAASYVVTVNNPNVGIPIPGTRFDVALPANLTYDTSRTPSSTCGGTSTLVGSTIQFRGGTLPGAPNGTTPGVCTISMPVTSRVAGNYTLNLAANAIDNDRSVKNAIAAGNTTLAVQAGVTIAKAFGSGVLYEASSTSVTITVNNLNAFPLTNTTVPDSLPTGLVVADTPAASTTCSGGSVTATANATSASLTNATIPAGVVGSPGSCTFTFRVKSNSAIGTNFTNTIGANTVTNTEGMTNAVVASASVLLQSALSLAKSFSSTSIVAGGTTRLSINLVNRASSQATGVNFTDNLPTNVTIAATPNVMTTNCGTPTVSAVANSGSIAVSSATINGNNTTCTVSVDVTSAVPNATGYTNSIPANSVTSNQGLSNPTAATANLVVTSPLATTSKAFTPTSVTQDAISTLRISIPNTSPTIAATGLEIVDNLPTNLKIANTSATLSNCGTGAVLESVANSGVLTVGSQRIALRNGTIAAGTTCTIDVQTNSNTLGTYSNTIPANSIVSTNNWTNPTAATANLVVTSPLATASKAFTPTSVTPGNISTLRISIPNTSSTIAATGVGIVDNLPTNLKIANATGVVSSNCGTNAILESIANSGVLTVGSQRISLRNATIAAGTTCTIDIQTSSTVPASYTNSIAANTIVSTNGWTNPTAFSSNLTVTQPLVVAKSFSPNVISPNGTSTLTFTVKNNAAVTANNVTVTDDLPTGLTVASPANTTASSSCGSSATVTANTSTQVRLNNGTIAAGDTCTVTFNVTGMTLNSYNNIIQTTKVSTTEGWRSTANASATLQVADRLMNVSKSFQTGTGTWYPGQTIQLTIGVQNTGVNQATSVSLTDNLPAGLVIASTPGITRNNCATNPTVTATAGTGVISFTGGAINSNQTCTVRVNVTATQPGTYTNTIPGGSLSSSSGTDANDRTASVTISQPLVLTKSFSPTSINLNSTSTLTLSVRNNATSLAANNVSYVDTLPVNLKYSGGTVNVSGCTTNTAPTITNGTNNNSIITVTGRTITAGGTCTMTIPVTSTIPGTYTNTIAANSITSTQNWTDPNDRSATLTVNSPLTINKSFNATNIAPGGTSRLTINVGNGNTTQAVNGLALTDSFPTNFSIANPANISKTNCGATSTVTGNPGNTQLSISGGTIATSGTCTIAVDVIGTTPGTYTNTIAANTLSSTNGWSNDAAATANITVRSGLSVNKNFLPATIVAGRTSRLTINIPNTAAATATGVDLTDTLPTAVKIANPPNLSLTNCGEASIPPPSTVAAAGSNTISITNARVSGNSTCKIEIDVTSRTIGTHTNTIPANSLNSTQGWQNETAATTNLIVQSGLTIAKTFSPPVVVPGAPSQLTIVLTNQSTFPLTSSVLTDNLPGNLRIAPVPNASTTCPNGTVTATAGSNSFRLNGATIPAQYGGVDGSCIFQADIINNTLNATETNTIAANSLTSQEGISNVNATTATLTTQNLSISINKGFNPVQVQGGSTTTLTVRIDNPNSISLSNVGFIDTMPTGMVVAGTPAAATTCPNGIVTAVPSQNTFRLTGADLAAGGTCTVTLKVTSTVGSNLTNILPTGIVTTAQGATNSQGAQATLTALPALNVQKSFSPGSIPPGGTGRLTVTVINANDTGVTGVGLTDTFPAGLAVANPANITNTCQGNVTVGTDINNLATVTLTGGILDINTTCTFGVDVTATTLGSLTNNIPGGSVSTTEGATNQQPTSATLNVLYQPTISKVFTSNTIAANGTSTLTLTVGNNNAQTLAGATLVDNFPTQIRIAQTPNASTTCPNGVINAVAGSNFLSLTGANLPASGTCTITTTVTSLTPGIHTNTIPIGNLTTAEGTRNIAAASANLTVLNYPSVSKVFTPAQIPANGNAILTITLNNPNAIAINNVTLSDNFPAGLQTINNTVATTCTGTMNQTLGSVGLTNATIPANSNCQITVRVTSTQQGNYTNTIQSGDLSSSAGINQTPATAIVEVGASSNNPNMFLVKRITRINGQTTNTLANGGTVDLTAYVDGNGTADDSSNWPINFLKGAIDAGIVKPGDEVEYTIYFRQEGAPVREVSLCDLIPSQTTFSRNTYGSGLGVQLQLGSNITNPSNTANDSDGGYFLEANSNPPSACRRGGASLNIPLTGTDIVRGAVVVNLASGSDTFPANTTGAPNYGFFRFRAKVD
jgi:uncharacterized repeat protein (TIGR01451 family)